MLIHIKDEYFLHDGRIDILKIRPLAHISYYYFTTIDSTFEMLILGSNDLMMCGLEGDARRTRE
jgi:hypothetical protein